MRYHSIGVAGSFALRMEGQLAEHPLAELIREITRAGLSGVLRLERDRAKVVVYFDEGSLIFAASNVRAHRLREVLRRSGVAGLDAYPPSMPDDELAKVLQAAGKATAERLQQARANQACDVLRVALLWTEGQWQFDARVRLGTDSRVQLDVGRLLLECARHLPFSFIKSRLERVNGGYSFAHDSASGNLLPSETAVLSRAANAGKGVQIADLKVNGTAEEDSLRGIYGLSLSGQLEPGVWPSALDSRTSQDHVRASQTPGVGPAQKSDDAAEDVEALFDRLKSARDHYELLEVTRGATEDEIKQAYHSLALRFHPDRFHQSEPALRGRIESAFARLAHAYEVLGDEQQRNNYDKRIRKSEAASPQSQTKGATNTRPTNQSDRAESSFQRGLNALETKQFDEAIRALAEAAMLAPREARYRANYGYALMSRANMRRTAETELQAALAIEPTNASYRVMLAELYQSLGLRRRAEGEAARALSVDPTNKAARALLSNLKNG